MRVEVEIEDDGRFIAEVLDIPGALAYGNTADEAVRKVESLVLRILADRIDAGEESEELANCQAHRIEAIRPLTNQGESTRNQIRSPAVAMAGGFTVLLRKHACNGAKISPGRHLQRSSPRVTRHTARVYPPNHQGLPLPAPVFPAD